MLRVGSRPPHSPPRLIDQTRCKGRREIDRQNLRLPMSDAVITGRPDPSCVVCPDLFNTPGSTNLVFRIEIVIEFDVELLPDISGAKAETILPTPCALDPAGSRGVEAFANFPVVNCRHD